MKISNRIVNISLDKNTEDIALLNDIRNVIAEQKFKSIKEFAEKYSALYALMQCLEMREQEDDNYY